MSTCDMCGKETNLVQAEIDGAELKVCSNCSKYGLIKKKIREQTYKPRFANKKTQPDFKIVNNYSFLIKQARESKGLKQEDLARAIAEKESVIHQLESSKLKPNFKLVNKLEVFLNISLMKQVETSLKSEKNIGFKSSNVTIGDLLSKKE